MNKAIPVYIINLRKRLDRKAHILSEFKDRSEFHVSFINPIIHDIPSISLWKTIKQIVGSIRDCPDEFIIVCEDDHCFSENYNFEEMMKTIIEANKSDADLLLGGVSHFEDAVEITDTMFWLSNFTGFQFVIMFPRFYKKFQDMELLNNENVDLKMGEISNNIYCIYPFISTQKEFGYSDVTAKNRFPGIVQDYFEKSEKRLKTLFQLKRHFEKFYN